MKKLAGLLILAVCLGTPLSARGQAVQNDTIVFNHGKPGDAGYAIVKMKTDGSEHKTLTDGGKIDADPALSPDGSQIAFVTIDMVSRESTLNVMSSDGENRHVLATIDGIVVCPAWSPDGRHIAYTSLHGTQQLGFIVAVDGSDNHPVGPDHIFQPRWSPDGKNLAYVRLDEPNKTATLEVANADGTSPHVALQQNEPIMMYAWAPDGKHLAYTSGQPSHIYLIAVEGGEKLQLTPSESAQFGPEFSSDGKRVYFNRTTQGESNIWSVGIDGKDPQAITSETGQLNVMSGGLLLINVAAKRPTPAHALPPPSQP